MSIKDLVEEAGYPVKRKAATHGGEYSSPCPFCKEGDDRFIIQPNRHNKNGDYNGGRYACRVCGKYGDAISFLCELHGLSYLDACARLKLAPKTKQSIAIARKPYKPLVAADSPSAWIEKATTFVEWCHSKLMSNSESLANIQKRGFSLDSIVRYKIGFNPGDSRGYDFMRDRLDWGLEEQLKEDGTQRKLWLPIGITIPTLLIDGRVIKVKVRRIRWKEGDKLPKYVEISGSKSCPSVYGDTKLPVGLESELDSLLVQQFASDLLYCVALGGSTKLLDAETDKLLRRTKHLLFLPDFDKAGGVAWGKWQNKFHGIQRILTPHEKSAGDYHIAGGDLREWLISCITQMQR
jgi:hypothetical protein